MRVISWNCNMAFRNKKDRLLEYDPDILIIQECENPEFCGKWDEFSKWIWVGENKNKGLGIFSRNNFKIESVEESSCLQSRYITRIKVKSKNEYLLFAVWAMNDKTDIRKRYIGQVFTALEFYKEYLGPNSLVIGDFNWNAIWDAKPDSPLYGNLSDTVRLLESKGITSLYHSLFKTDYGKENDPTLFLLKKQNRPYHIDYVFIKRDEIKNVKSFKIGTYDEWIRYSDHMPIMFELAEV